MKKTLILAVLVGLLAPSVSSAQITTNLKYGQRNSQVYELQDFLVDKGFLNSSVTGFFGLMTLKAVKAYQTSEGLPSTGFVGSLTRSAINAELSLISGAADEAELAETGATTSVATAPRQTPVATTTIIERIIERPIFMYKDLPATTIATTTVVTAPANPITAKFVNNTQPDRCYYTYSPSYYGKSYGFDPSIKTDGGGSASIGTGAGKFSLDGVPFSNLATLEAEIDANQYDFNMSGTDYSVRAARVVTISDKYFKQGEEFKFNNITEPTTITLTIKSITLKNGGEVKGLPYTFPTVSLTECK